MAKQDCDCAHEHENCDCGCDEELVVLQDADGNDVNYHYVFDVEHEGKEYVFLQSADEEEDDMIEIYQVETVEENGEEISNLYPVDGDLYEVLLDKLWEAVGDECDCDCDHDNCDCDHGNADGEHGENCDCGCRNKKDDK